ncbi:T6SS effector phospholipase Tle3 domain-containing protein [Oryzomicrobium sp.]|uniref:T6SS effector phospholipase Tle3 domain-containing protein n=1 Tax=Oryzomicrobium sp. TaxID=1911578 RepID=UPI002FE073C5
MTENSSPGTLIVDGGTSTLSKGSSPYDLFANLPLPGVYIFVHGVNSDGEWFEQAEQGLCAGLNDRLKRRDAHMAHPDVGTLTAPTYHPELTDDGFIDRKFNHKRFIKKDGYSPVIRFRWGYKADDAALKEYGDKIWLNELHAWGGGPFANGCTNLPDAWGEGLNPRLFLWVSAQHLNTTSGRRVYDCPPRSYYAHAAHRLARLVQRIREKQKDIPITIVCHSQGNIIGMAAAFIGDTLDADAVADRYVLANPPYSLVPDNLMESWSQRGDGGRQTGAARMETLKAFVDLIGARKGKGQPAGPVNDRMAHRSPKDGSAPFAYDPAAEKDGPGRITLYFNPHDQLISVETIRGIGWMGLDRKQLDTVDPGGKTFVQRVFAEGKIVGKTVSKTEGKTEGKAEGKTGEEIDSYDFWKENARGSKTPGTGSFFYPASPKAKYVLENALDPGEGVVVKVLSLLTVLVIKPLVDYVIAKPVNAAPPKNWTTPINAPALPEPFLPRSVRYGKEGDFDQGHDPDRDALSQENPKDGTDPLNAKGEGDRNTQAALRYQYRAEVRLSARRAKKASADGTVPGDPGGPEADEEWNAWAKKEQMALLNGADQNNSVDHGTIMTNPAHAQKALAWDVAIGMAKLSLEDWLTFRKVADWRLMDDKTDPDKFGLYFKSGKLEQDKYPHQLARYRLEGLPPKIKNERTWATKGERHDA